ncbi:MAG: benzoate-CoA ligase family protein [Rhodospirillales bacterium]|jgi:benzoate-CoA ligase family protein
MNKVRKEAGQDGLVELKFPSPFNAAEYYIDRHLREGRSDKLAIQTAVGGRRVTYGELAKNVNKFGNALLSLGVKPGERVLMTIKDCPEFYFVYWGAIKAGIIPVPLNTLLRAKDYQFIINDSKCAGMFYSPEFGAEVELALSLAEHKPAQVHKADATGFPTLADKCQDTLAPVAAEATDDCFWLYSSGTTGQPKGVVHAHKDMVATCELYAVDVLGALESDAFFSVPKLFFAYGLGCAMTFPLWVGGSVVLDERRPTPQTVLEVLRAFKPTVFAAVPTMLAALLSTGNPGKEDLACLRRAISGGEALPPDLQRRWLELTSVPIMDGIGSTELLHIYVSNRLNDIKPGASGTPVPGYRARILDNSGHEVPIDEVGRLWIKGPSSAKYYWNNPAKTAETLVDGWLNTGDTYRKDKDGYYYYCGRNDDMLKVGGIWVSPFEIESTLIGHPMVLEAAVVGRNDENGLVKPEAFVVLKDARDESENTVEDIRAFCKSNMAPYKFPRWINFVPELPKTATGKIQRFKLRN